MKDNQLKLIELPSQFSLVSTSVEISIRQNQRVLETLANSLSYHTQSFDKELLKDFVVKVAQTNQEVLNALKYVRDLLQSVADDQQVVDNSRINNIIQEQSETIIMLQNQRDNFIRDYAESRRDTQHS